MVSMQNKLVRTQVVRMDSLHADSKLSLLDETTNATVRTPLSVRSTLHRIDAFTLGSGEMGNAKKQQ